MSLLSLKEVKADFLYYVDVSYERTHCTGHCDDYCRCTSLVNTRVKPIDHRAVVSRMLAGCTNPLLVYCAERVLRFSKIDNVDSWDVKVGGGYYGQEIHGVFLDDDIANKICSHFQTLNNCSPKEMVEYVLKMEYGFVLPAIEAITNWSIQTVDYESIIFPNQDRFEYTRKVDAALVEMYTDWPYPLGVAVRVDGNKNRLIDGYHRTQTKCTGSVELVIGVP
jgi:hypothetical protein